MARVLCCCAGVGLLLTAGAAGADSLTDIYSANHINLRADSTSSYDAPIPVIAAPGAVSATAPIGVPPYIVEQTSLALPSATTTIKDKAYGDLKVEFIRGTATTDDKFAFHINDNASAVTSLDAVGNPASAKVVHHGVVNFFLDATTATPADTLLGFLDYPAITVPTVASPSTISVTGYIQMDGPTGPIIGTFGSAAGSIPLKAQHGYAIYLDSVLQVPFGADPPFSIDYGFTVALPEPGSLMLLAGGVLMASRRQRRR